MSNNNYIAWLYSTTFVLFDYFSDTILSQIIMESQENGGNHYVVHHTIHW